MNCWNIIGISRGSHPEVFLRKGVLKICSMFTGEHPCRMCDFSKVAKQLYLNCTSAWVFSCKFTVYFQNNFLKNTSGRLLLYFWFHKLYSSQELIEQTWWRLFIKGWFALSILRLTLRTLNLVLRFVIEIKKIHCRC